MWLWILGLAVVTVVLYDLLQRRHAILRSFPIIGHFRYILEPFFDRSRVEAVHRHGQ